MSNIPKIAHLSWITKDIIESKSPIILNGLRNLIDMNPDWKINIYNNEEIDEYLKGALGKDYKIIEDLHIVPKSDIWRLFKLYYEGGLYVDIDRWYNIPMSEVIPEGVDWILPTYLDQDFSHDFMCSAPGNQVFTECINLHMNRRLEGHTSVYFLGPQTWMHAVTKTLFDQIIDSNPGKEVFEQIRDQISKIPNIKTFREELPFNSVIYNHDPQLFKMGSENTMDWEILKRKFYKEFKLKHWTGDW